MRYFMFLILAASALAQTPAGGKWLLIATTDNLTDAKGELFSLSSDTEIEDNGIRFVPILSLSCDGKGHLSGAPLQTGVVLSTSNFEGDYLYKLRVRTDDKYTDTFWNRYADGKTLALTGMLGKRWLKKILNAQDVRMEIPAFSGALLVARFSPAGLNRDQVAKSCGLK